MQRAYDPSVYAEVAETGASSAAGQFAARSANAQGPPRAPLVTDENNGPRQRQRQQPLEQQRDGGGGGGGGGGAQQQRGARSPPWARHVQGRCTLDYQSSFAYGAGYKDSTGRIAWENHLRSPARLDARCGKREGDLEARRWWAARWKEGNELLMREGFAGPPQGSGGGGGGGSRARRFHGSVDPRFRQSFDFWADAKEREAAERRAREEEAAERERARRAAVEEASAVAVRQWGREKRREQKKASREGKQARLAAKRGRRADRKQRAAATARYEEEQRGRAEARQRAAEARRQEAAARRLTVERELDERTQRTEEAFDAWVRDKAAAELSDKQRRAEETRVREELARREREAKWAKKAVVLAYSRHS